MDVALCLEITPTLVCSCHPQPVLRIEFEDLRCSELTASCGVDGYLLDWQFLVQESALGEQVEGLVTLVDESNLDLRVASSLELNSQRCLTLVDINRCSRRESDQRCDSEGLHDGQVRSVRTNDQSCWLLLERVERADDQC